MIKKLKNILIKYQTKRFEKQLMKKMTASVELQRNGKIKEFAEASKEIAELEEELDRLSKL